MVFDGKNKEHAKFAPVVRWLNGGGRMIYGGTKYNAELGRLTKILGLVIELSKRRKTIRLSNETVDQIADGLKARYPDPDFNDEHIVALVIASRCHVVCTDDNAAISYLRRKEVFSAYGGLKRPSIYRGLKSHSRLCSDHYIAEICRGRHR